MIEIKKNEYQQPIEVREFMVQGIIDAFLNRDCFHPFSQGNRDATLDIYKSSGLKHPIFICAYGIRYNKEHILGRIRGCEMKEAFRLIQEAGYYIFKVWRYGCWMGYVVSEKPYETFYKNATRVTEFNDFID